MRVYQNSNLMAMNLQSENCLFLFIIKEPCHYPLISLIRLFCAYSLYSVTLSSIQFSFDISSIYIMMVGYG